MKFINAGFGIICLSICINTAFGQEKTPVNFGKISPADFTTVASKVTDSNSNAVIIADVGNTSFVGNRKGWLSYVFKRQTRIKIIDKKAFDEATVKILLYKNGQDEEKLDNFEATCYNLDNGKVIAEKLDKKDLFEDRLDKNHIERKFTVPGIKEGSIIEYTYTIISDFDFNLPHWNFQHVQYPVLWSEYNVSIPTLLIYTSFKQGVHSFYIDQPGMSQQNYNIMHTADYNALTSGENSYIVSSQVVKHRWVMKDLPGLNIENYISTPNNYIDKIEFQLAKTYDGNATTDVVNSWAKYNEQLLSESDFGQALKPGYFDFAKEVNEVLGTETDPEQKAKKIYYYVQQAVTCTNSYRIYATNSLSKVLQNKSGNVAEVNLLLTAMLRQASLQADPVLLSTREYGFNSPNYPVLQRLNYVICRCMINGKSYYLDATRGQLGFGLLPGNCYNGHARIISDKDPGPVYFWADSLKEPNTTAVFIINDEKGKGLMSGSLETVPCLLESFSTRNRISHGSEKAFFADVQAANSDIKIENPGIDSMQKPEYPVKIHYDFSFNVDEKEDIIYYNPIIGSLFRENPLKAAERKYPVEMSYPIDDTYILNMEIPAGYILEELPKSSRVAYNGTEGFFEYLIQGGETNVQLKTHLKLNKAYFSPDEYNSLRDFFTYVIKKQGEQIVFKKKK